MQAKLEKGQLVIVLTANKEPVPSKSGKELLVASSHGFQQCGLTVNGKPVRISLNATIANNR